MICKREETRIAVIGLGFLMEYLYPCYGAYLGEKAAENIVAVTADEQDLPRKRQALPFEILLNDNAQALRKGRPDILLFAPPPAAAPQLIAEVLRPYFAQLREENRPLPDIYAFPPSPKGSFYQEQLGSDVHVCNLLPNLTNEIAGQRLMDEGSSYVTFPDGKAWEQERMDRLRAIFAPLGGVVEIHPDLVLKMLSGVIVADSMSKLVMTVAESLNACGIDLDHRQVAMVMRARHQQQHRYHPSSGAWLAPAGVPAAVGEALLRLEDAWYAGVAAFYQKVGFSQEKTSEILVPNFDLHLHLFMVESQAFIREDTRLHSTKGGILERACLCYDVLTAQHVADVFSKIQEEPVPDDFFRLMETLSCTVCDICARHAERLSPNQAEIAVEAQHNAVLYGLAQRSWQRHHCSGSLGERLPGCGGGEQRVQAGRRFGFAAGELGACAPQTEAPVADWKLATQELLAQLKEQLPQAALQEVLEAFSVVFGDRLLAVLQES